LGRPDAPDTTRLSSRRLNVEQASGVRRDSSAGDMSCQRYAVKGSFASAGSETK
jgi:hypothetical protein